MTPEERAVVERLLHVSLVPYTIRPKGNVGLVIVDPGVGFTRRGALSDPKHMVPMVNRIADEYRRLHETLGNRLHVLIFLDTHHHDIPEPPYPLHGVIGTGEEDIDPDLAFLLHEPNVSVIRKDCINGFVGGLGRHTHSNLVSNWFTEHEIRTALVTGDCTDICVLDFVVTCLSARNHGLLNSYRVHGQRARYVEAITGLDIVVLASACETFEAPGHDREAWHHVGLATMAARGAIIANDLVVD